MSIAGQRSFVAMRAGLALVLVLAGCANVSTRDDAGLDVDAIADGAVDSAWCSAVTCERLYYDCHAGFCDPSVMFPPCFDTTRGVCSSYTCTAPCIHDAGTR